MVTRASSPRINWSKQTNRTTRSPSMCLGKLLNVSTYCPMRKERGRRFRQAKQRPVCHGGQPIYNATKLEASCPDPRLCM